MNPLKTCPHLPLPTPEPSKSHCLSLDLNSQKKKKITLACFVFTGTTANSQPCYGDKINLGEPVIRYKRTQSKSQESWVHNLIWVTNQLTFLNPGFPICKQIEPDDLQGLPIVRFDQPCRLMQGAASFFITSDLDSTNIYSTRYGERHCGRQTYFLPSQDLQFREGEKTAN